MTDVVDGSTRDAARMLRWEGCFNVRDLGGMPTEDGSETRRGAVLRGDSPYQLASCGWDPLRGAGVTMLLDLRSAGELAGDAGEPPVKVVRVPLLSDRDA